MAEAAAAPAEGSPAPAEELPALPFDPLYIRILCALLRGESVTELLRAGHLMPSVIADEINGELFDEFGDSIITCEDDRIALVEDYREELACFLEETS